ncbi:AraC family transcriptional regulator [soil metagenome]
MGTQARALLEHIVPLPGESFVCREFASTRFTMPWHFHPECELTLIVKGRGLRYVGDSIERFEDGELVLLGSSLPHYWWQSPDDQRKAHSVVVQFAEGFAGGMLELEEAREIRQLLVRARRGLFLEGSLRDEITRDLSRLKELSGWKKLCLLLEILGRLAADRSRFLASAGYAPDLDERDGRRLVSVCQYVNESFGESVRHPKAASLAGLSPAAFSRFFRKRMGKTFEAYVTEVRIGHACRRLTEADSRITEVAFGVGFNNLSNFNRHFRKLKGLSPREYRQSFVK